MPGYRLNWYSALPLIMLRGVFIEDINVCKATWAVYMSKVRDTTLDICRHPWDFFFQQPVTWK